MSADVNAMIWLAALVYLPMLAEAVHAARHERTQRARGGIEPTGDVYRVMRIVYPLGFALIIAEGVARGGVSPRLALAGAALFAAAKGLKWWAILALGDRWTFRVIVVPGAPLVIAGPYRWLRHPNYVGVAGELVSVSLMAGAIVMGPIVTLLFVALMLARIRVEERALGAILGPASTSSRPR